MNKKTFKCDRCDKEHTIESGFYISAGYDRVLCIECGDETLAQPNRLVHDEYNYMDVEFELFKKVL